MSRRLIVGERVYLFYDQVAPVRWGQQIETEGFFTFSHRLFPRHLSFYVHFRFDQNSLRKFASESDGWKRTGRDGFVRKKQNSHFDHFPLFHPGLKTTWSRKFPLRDLSLSFYLTKLPLFESQKTYEGVSVNKSMVWLIAL